MAKPFQNPIILDADDVSRLLGPAACRRALRDAYAALFRAREDRPQSAGFKAERGKFHVKSGLLPGSQRYFAAKINANFPDNPITNGLPSIQGLVALFDAQDGRPLAIMDSAALTGLRTAAAAALAAAFGARADSSRLALVGAGAQAPFQLAAMADAFALRKLRVFDVDINRAESLAQMGRGKFGFDSRVVNTVAAALEECDIAVTLTPSRTPIVDAAMLRPGLFLAALGADNPDKHEIAPDVFGRARIICDDVDECAKGGDLGHALRAGAISRDAVAADLAALCAGAAKGRTNPEEVVVYDSTGSGLQDVAAAAALWETRTAQ